MNIDEQWKKLKRQLARRRDNKIQIHSTPPDQPLDQFAELLAKASGLELQPYQKKFLKGKKKP